MNTQAKKTSRLAKHLRQLKSDHDERHRPSGFGFAVADRVTALNAEHWDLVTAGQAIFLSRSYLELLADTGPAELRQRVALIYERNEPVAAVSTQLLEVTGEHLVKQSGADSANGPKKLQRLVAAAKAKIATKSLQTVRARVLVCGNLFSWGPHGVAFRKGVEPSRVWPGVAEVIYRIRKAESLTGSTDFVLIKDWAAKASSGIETLQRFSYRPLETEPDMVLELAPTWTKYEDYQQSLASKYRKAAKGILTEIEKAGLIVEQLDDTQLYADELYGLYKQVQQKATIRFAALTPEYFGGLSRAFGPENFRCTIIRQAAKLVGFVTTVKDGDTAVGYYIGFDYVLNDSLPIYLRLMHAVIADAIALDCRRVSYGRTALEPKARLGAKPVPLQVWLRHRVPALNLIVRRLLKFVSHDEPPERNAFKAE